MTEKELSYVSDAIGHEKNIVKICTETCNYLEETELKDFIKDEIKKHEDNMNNLLHLLEVNANE
ncbi:MAG: hypothetical protein IKI04_02770 [Bacilli bacterium]|nr:hypothetical protein [Bacilli bacterium]